MARFLVKASEFKNVCKAVNDRKLAELKKEIIEILKKQDDKDFKKAIDYLEAQELHYTHLEKSINGKWIQKAGYGVGTVRIWKGKKYKKIAPGKWARVFDKEGRGTNIAIGKLIAKVQKIDNVEDLMAFVMQNKQRFVDENGIDLPVLDKLRAAVDAKNNGGMRSKTTSKPAEKTDEKYDRELVDSWKDDYKNFSTDALKEKIEEYTKVLERAKNDNPSPDQRVAVKQNEHRLKALNELLEEKKNNPAEKKGESKNPVRLKHVVSPIEFTDNHGNKIRYEIDEVKDAPEDYQNPVRVYKVEGNVRTEIAGNVKNYEDAYSAVMEQVEKTKEGTTETEKKYIDESIKTLPKEDSKGNKIEESEAEKTQNRSEAMKGNQNARKFGADWEEKRKEIQSKLSANVDKMLEGHDKAKDVYEKLQSNLDKRKADAELYRKYLGNQEEPEDVKDFRKWCDDVIEQYRKEVTKTPSKEIISKWEETARNTPTEKLEEVYNGKQKVDYSNEYENFIDSTIINEFAKDKDLIFPQPYTMLKDIATRKFDNSDKIRLEVIKKELDARKNGTKAEFKKTKNLSDAMKGNKNAYKGGSKEELQNELMSLSKQKSEILDEIKKTNGDLAKINQDKYNDEARGNPTEDYDKQIEELKKKMDNLQDEHADIEKRGNDIVKELDKLEKEENKVIENNPKSIEGMEFVNKNKMHALANFLANHDNVNMATAVIRLQAAYEKLGEEKFLSYFPKDVVERYRKEAGKEETKKESFTPISKDKMKSMSDDELKDYEAKLEKDLLATSRTDPDYAEKYNHWREVHGENNDRFHQAIEDEARAEKQAEADAKSAKEKEIKEKYHGYFDSRSGLDKARDLKTLEKKYNFDGKVMSSKEFVEQAMDNGVEIKEREVNKLDYPSRTRWNRMNGYEQDEYEKRIKAAGKKTVYSINGFEFPKTVVDYAKFYKEKGKSKSGNEKPSKSETAIKNKATSLAGAFGYSKTYAEKMGFPFNLELAEQTVDEELDWDEGSKKALKEELKRIYSEKKVQKSLFDDFVMDMFIDEDEEIEDAIKTDESLFNDYSAEQPELFNSTEMKVQEAFNRCGCCL